MEEGVLRRYTLIFFNKPEAKAIEDVNAQISEDDASSLLAAFHNEHAELQNVDDNNQLHYLTLLQAALRAKRQVKICILEVWLPCVYNFLFSNGHFIKSVMIVYIILF